MSDQGPKLQVLANFILFPVSLLWTQFELS